MTLFQMAACLNNEGVNKLMKGDESSCIEYMAEAIQLLKEDIVHRAAIVGKFQKKISPKLQLRSQEWKLPTLSYLTRQSESHQRQAM
jgi:hypothetical protein